MNKKILINSLNIKIPNLIEKKINKNGLIKEKEINPLTKLGNIKKKKKQKVFELENDPNLNIPQITIDGKDLDELSGKSLDGPSASGKLLTERDSFLGLDNEVNNPNNQSLSNILNFLENLDNKYNKKEKDIKIFIEKLQNLGKIDEYIPYFSLTIVTEIGMLYLCKKYNYNSIIKDVNKRVGLFIDSILYYETGTDAQIEKSIKEYIDIEKLGLYLLEIINNKNKEYQNILIPLIIPTHQNLLVYQTKYKVIYRFEPHGKRYDGGKNLNDSIEIDRKINLILKYLFEKKLKKYIGKVNYISPMEYWDNLYEVGFQTLENNYIYNQPEEWKQEADQLQDGFCQLWSLLIAELVLINDNLSFKEIIKNFVEIITEQPLKNKFMYDIIKGYFKNINNTLDEIKIYAKLNINSNYIKKFLNFNYIETFKFFDLFFYEGFLNDEKEGGSISNIKKNKKIKKIKKINGLIIPF